jgi:hypothetical protein
LLLLMARGWAGDFQAPPAAWGEVSELSFMGIAVFAGNPSQ